jgi:hypothetical protein
MDIDNYLEPVLEKWHGKIIITENSIYLTEEGLSLLNSFLVDIASLIDSTPLIITSKEINWPL